MRRRPNRLRGLAALGTVEDESDEWDSLSPRQRRHFSTARDFMEAKKDYDNLRRQLRTMASREDDAWAQAGKKGNAPASPERRRLKPIVEAARVREMLLASKFSAQYGRPPPGYRRARPDQDEEEFDLDGLAANGQRGSQALPLATIALVGIAGFVLWKLLSSGESETGERETVGTGPCRDIDSQLATPIGCGTAAVTGYVGGKGSPITIREIPGAPGYYLQSSPVDVWSAFQRLKAAAVNAGHAVTVNSAFRTMAKQSALYADYMAGRGNKAARPGYSKHQNGTAIDLAVKQGSLLSWLRSNASAYGFFETVLGENWHWEYDPARDRYARIA